MPSWTMIVIDPTGSISYTEYGGPPPLEELQEAVGGYIELVPRFDKVVVDGVTRRCIAYCNEYGKDKNLPSNPWAQSLWEVALGRKITEDHLVGPVVILVGDEKWMAEL